MIRLILAAIIAATPTFTRGNEVYFQGGISQKETPDTSWTLQSGFNSKIDRNLGVDFSYVNEGHTTNNHRDGFILQGTFQDDISDNVSYQVGFGPYFSNNNTLINGQRLNDFEIGLASSITAKYYLDRHWHLRLQYTNISIATPNSNSVLAGVGYDFEGRYYESAPGFVASAWAGTSRTTQIGTQSNATSAMIDVKRLTEDRLSYSVGFLNEGDTQLADRTGIYAQGWYDYRPTREWRLSGGIGPYLAQDQRRLDDQTKLMMVGSIRATREYSGYEIGVTFNRVTSFYNRDQDMFMIGLGKKF